MNRAHHSEAQRIRWPGQLRTMGFCCLLAAFFCSAVVSSVANARAEPVRVLVIHSYHKGFSWTDDVQRGIESVFEKSGEDIEIAVEYMDAKRHPVRQVSDKLADLYEFKYRRRRPDLMISCDDDALNFLFEYRDAIFPGTSVVFCGLDVESYDPSLLNGRQGYTGVVERLDLTGTIDLILDLQPAVERIAVLGHFAGSISHELRNPLGAIDSSLYFLKMKFGTGDEKIAETVQIETIFPENEVIVEVDADQIRMAIKNIVHNAVQAMGGAGTLTVNVRTPDEGRVEIRISDTGPGIPPENIEKVFQPLFSTKVHGIGFGLSIVRMIVENHGGRIRAESPVDGGARFVITLPIDRPSRF